jgi:hypothetical protein
MSRFDKIEQGEIAKIAKKFAGGGGGVTDHGALTGLGDDDHTQYHNNARGDARYSQLGHTHDHGTLTGLGDDDHTQYHNDARGDARYSQLGHTHVLANVTDYYTERADPTNKIVLVEDFFSNTLTTGLLGDLDWRFTNGSVSERTAEAGHPGVIRRTSAATSLNVASMHLGSALTSALFRWDQFEECTFVIKLESLASNCIYRVGISNSVGSSPPNIGVYFETTITAGAGNWGPVMKNAANTNATVNAWAAGTGWIKLKIRRVSNTQAGFTFDTNSEVIETLGSPNNIQDSDTMQWFLHIMPNGVNTARSVDFDYFSAIIAAQTR